MSSVTLLPETFARELFATPSMGAGDRGWSSVPLAEGPIGNYRVVTDEEYEALFEEASS